MPQKREANYDKIVSSHATITLRKNRYPQNAVFLKARVVNAIGLSFG